MQRQTRELVIFTDRGAHRHRGFLAIQIEIAPAEFFQFAVTNARQHRRQVSDALLAGPREQGRKFGIIIRTPGTNLLPASIALFDRQQWIDRNSPLLHKPSKETFCALRWPLRHSPNESAVASCG